LFSFRVSLRIMSAMVRLSVASAS